MEGHDDFIFLLKINMNFVAALIFSVTGHKVVLENQILKPVIEASVP